MPDEFSFVGGGEIVWRPSAEVVARSRLQQFMNRHGLRSVEELHRRSTDDIGWFWEAVLAELGIEFDAPYRQIVDTSRGIQWPVWCVDGMMNIVHNCLDKWQGTATVNRAALRWEGEEGQVRVLTYGDLY
ncbi:MAG: acetyl-coenzyme A synthetase N-terminal domain-containing protein, partial [Anaerolineae bacterium]